MDDYDRERSSRTNDPYGRNRSSGELDRASSREAPSDSVDESSIDPFSKPGRNARRRSRHDDEILTDARATQNTRLRESGSTGAPQRYSDRFRRSRSADIDDPIADDRSLRSTRDPYDRLRNTTSRPPRRVEFDPDDDADLSYLDEAEETRHGGSTRPRRPPTRRQTPRVESQLFRAVGASLANPAPEIRPLAIGGIAALASLLLLCILVLVRSNSLAAWIPMHLDAEGTADEYGTMATIWRLPFFALMSTLAAMGIGWWLRSREAYATQFLIVGALLIHGLIWVGAINMLW